MSKKIILMGHGFGLTTAAQILREVGHQIVGIVTHPREEHLKDKVADKCKKDQGVYGSVFDLAQQYQLPLREEKNLNTPECILWLQSLNPDYLFSFGLRSIIRKNFFDAFPENRVLNIHATPLPRYRGGATDTWMVLNNERETYGVCHVIDEGIDTGPIVSKVPYIIPEKARPIDIYKKRIQIYGDLVLQAIKNLENPSFTPATQPIDQGFTLPKLSTDVDGQINWHQPALSIERHVRAFSTPYAGAFTYLRNHRVRITDGYVEENHHESFHPNAIGIVIGQTLDGGWRILTGRDIYVISKFHVEPLEGLVPPKIRPAVCFQSKTRKEISEELKK